MATIRLPYVIEYLDRHGKSRRYFRRKGQKLIPLPGHPGSREFREAYEVALDTTLTGAGATTDNTKPGTVAALVAAYYRSSEYKSLAQITKATYRREIEKFRRDHGDKRIALLEREHVKRLIANKAELPGAANKLLRIVRMLMRFAVDSGLRKHDPTVGIRKLKVRNGGFRPWGEKEIAAFEAAHPVGTRARLALALLLYTAQRRSDVIRMGWQHVRGGQISIKQQKTGASLWLPIHPTLESVLAATPRSNLTFLITGSGKPFSGPGFGNWFGDCCRKAGLPVGFNAHGLRKAAARRLAEAGCSSKQIMAVTGHRSLEEVERYTLSVEQMVLAREAFARLGTEQERSVSNLVSNPKEILED
jgi:integrase